MSKKKKVTKVDSIQEEETVVKTTDSVVMSTKPTNITADSVLLGKVQNLEIHSIYSSKENEITLDKFDLNLLLGKSITQIERKTDSIVLSFSPFFKITLSKDGMNITDNELDWVPPEISNDSVDKK